MKFRIFMILACSFACTIEAMNLSKCQNKAIDLINKVESNELFKEEDSFKDDFFLFTDFLDCTIFPIFTNRNLLYKKLQDRDSPSIEDILNGFGYLFEHMDRAF
jgi:hypothetical protein